jgi:Ca2+-binding EF-hand superfamily protein
MASRHDVNKDLFEYKKAAGAQPRVPSLAGAGSLSQLTEDAPDMEGQVIAHWSEDAGSVRWALVEPNLADLQKELRDIEDARKRLQQTMDQPIIDDLETLLRRMAGTTYESQEWLTGLSFAEWQEQFGLSRSLFDYIDENRDGEVSWQEFTSVNRVRNQLNALKAKEEALEEALDQYKPDEHAPECIAEGGQGMILVGKDLSTGDKVAIKVERVLKVRALKRESARERESERESERARERESERENERAHSKYAEPSRLLACYALNPTP